MTGNTKLTTFAMGSNRRYVKAVILATVVLVLSTALSCNDKKVISNSNPNSNPNIIMIVVDTLRADHLSTYGYPRNTDPNLTDFAKQAVVFQNATASSNWTRPTYASMLTGKMVFHNFGIGTGFPPTYHMLTSNLESAGYHTATIQTNIIVKELLSGGTYFNESYYYLVDPGNVFLDKEAAIKAADWLSNAANTKDKFFLFIGLISPHWPYKTDNGFLGEFVGDTLYNALDFTVEINASEGSGYVNYNDLSSDLQAAVGMPQRSDGYYDDARLYIAAYDSDIKYADYQIGNILRKLKDAGLYDNSIIIITADHGDNMIDHQTFFRHADNLYQSLLHVPLFMKFPRQTDKKIVAEYVRTVDILPTVLDYSAISYSGIDGLSLLPVINGETVDFEERPVISYWPDDSGELAISIIKDNYKLIRNSTSLHPRLYNLQNDPRETTDLTNQEPAKVVQLKDYLGKFFDAW